MEGSLLNWAARYYPILRVLKKHDLFSTGSILEIGCGPVGLGKFRKVPFTGCDLSFPDTPQWPMTPVIASATDLPFGDKSFDAVIASDVLEHIPPELRSAVIQETLRVAGKLVIFCFPSGKPAHDADRELRERYLSKGLEVPVWLEEHMLASFPDDSLFETIPGWNVTQIGNESIRFHSWMMRREMYRQFVRVSSEFLRLRWLLEPLLRLADAPPYYRQMFVLAKNN